MPETRWQVLPPHLHAEMRFNLALLIAHRQIFDRHFAVDPSVNRALGFHLHGYQQLDGWRLVQILTPWMLARLWFAERGPGITIPHGGGSDDAYQPLGTRIALPSALGQGMAYLHHHATLGHYLLQPITLDMSGYQTAHELFEAWREELLPEQTRSQPTPERKAV